MSRRLGSAPGVIPRARSGSGWSSQRELATSLHEAIDAGDITVVYQPIFGLGDHVWTGLEALARWRHPERGQVPPDVFIPVAEECGLIGDLTKLVGRQVGRDWCHWRRRPMGRTLQVAINVSAIDVATPSTLDSVVGGLAQDGLPLDQLTLEITETAPLRVDASSVAALQGIRDAGSQIALDDFGTGHSRLGDLRRVPVTTLKLDKSFTHDATPGLADPEMAAGVQALADSFGLATIAEGVETADEAHALSSLGYDEVQGYLYGRPMARQTVTRALNGGCG